MLVLGRTDGETICIGDNIEITVVSTSTGRCRIGITAPDNVKILRKELLNGRKANAHSTNRLNQEQNHKDDSQNKTQHGKTGLSSRKQRKGQ